MTSEEHTEFKTGNKTKAEMQTFFEGKKLEKKKQILRVLEVLKCKEKKNAKLYSKYKGLKV